MRLDEGESCVNGMGMRSLSDELDCTTSGLLDEERHIHEFEERLRVDRRKLEQMLQGMEYNCKEESADEFFHRIMTETNTHIYWPSQLKVGAKSKKDPHIKICGKADAVWKAKEKILEVLDAKRNRVTLKMDVSYTDHSHIIGKGGHNIQQVMEETGCHIHFPDSNRSNQLEKSNQVSITGEPAGVEKARNLVRDLLPVVIMFELPVTGFLQPIPDSSSPDLQFIQQACGFTVSFRQRSKGTPTTVIVRGCQKNLADFHKGILVLMEYLTGSKGAALPVTMSLEISPQHHAFVMGRGGLNIHKIMQQTGSTITFPRSAVSSSEQGQQRKSTVLISGHIEGVYITWQHLMNLLPLVLMFDLKEGQDVDATCLNRTLEQLNISILLRPKQKYNTKSVTVKGPEKDSLMLFDVRKRLLGLDNTEFPPPHKKNDLSWASAVLASKNTCINIQESSDHLDPVLNAQNSSGVMQLLNNYGRQCLSLSSVPCPPPLSSSLGSPLLPLLLSQLSTSVGNSSPLSSPLLDAVTTGMLSQVVGKLSTQHEQNDPTVSVRRLSCPSKISSHSPVHSDNSCRCNPCNEEADPLTTAPRSAYQNEWITWNSEKELSNFPRRMSLTTESTPNMLGLVTSESLSNCHNTTHSVPLSPINSSSTDLSQRKDVGSIGCERKKGLTQNSFPPDYEHKKLLATRAMQKPIGSEARVPTSLWSGLGFSSSMPESTVKQRLRQVGILPSNSLHSSEEDISTSKEMFKEDCSIMMKSSFSRPEGLHNFSENLFSNSNYFEAIIPKLQSVHPETEDLPQLLSRQGLAKYVDTFHQQEIDLSIFLTMTDQDLLGLGITYGARRKMIRIISEINRQRIPQQQDKQFQAAPGAERSSLFFSRLAGQRPSPRLVDPCW